MMIWKVTFRTKTQGMHVIPVVADGYSEAIEKAKRMIPFVTEIDIQLASIVSNDQIEESVEQLSVAWHNMCDELIENGPYGDAVYIAGVGHYNETSTALWRAFYSAKPSLS